MADFETRLSRDFGRIGLVSQDDVDHLRQRSVRPDAVVHIPLPVDLEYFVQRLHRRRRQPALYVLTGRLNYIPNQHTATRLVTEIWPAIVEDDPTAQLLIVGADPSTKLLELARRHGVRVEANVPDIRTYLADAEALLVPTQLRGGVQNKILEAMACGVPVICTPDANTGVNATPDHHLLLAQDARSFQAQARRLREDGPFRTALVSEAVRWVTRNHSMDAFGQRFLAECEIVADPPQGVAANRTDSG